MSDDTNTTNLALGNQHYTHVPLGYYKCIEATRYIEQGQYVRVVHVERSGASGPSVQYQRRDSGYTHDVDDFLQHFHFAPEGAQIFQQDFQALTQEISAIADEVSSIEASLAHTAIFIDPHGQLPADLDTGTAIMPAADRSPQGYKRHLARVSTLATEKREQLTTMQKELKAMLAEQMAVADWMDSPPLLRLPFPCGSSC